MRQLIKHIYSYLKTEEERYVIKKKIAEILNLSKAPNTIFKLLIYAK